MTKMKFEYYDKNINKKSPMRERKKNVELD